jgi:hypothetical protein
MRKMAQHPNTEIGRWHAALAAQSHRAAALSQAVFRALPPHEQAARMARAWAGAARYHARRRGEPEPVITTFDAHLTEQDGVIIVPGSMREFDL